MTQKKIKSCLEFPKQLYMKYYCTEHLQQKENNGGEAAQKEDQKEDSELNTFVYSKEDNYYTYELVGVIVHIGIATAFYYSYINVKWDGEGDIWTFNPESNSNKWLIFNDSSRFNSKSYEEENQIGKQ
jgi:hypothetical protein